MLRLCHSTQQPGLRMHCTGIWQQGGGWDTGRLMALDCHTELRKAQPWQEGAALPQLCFRELRSRGDTASPCSPQPLPFSPSLGSPGCPNHPSCRLWEQLRHLRLCPGELCQGSVPSLCMLEKAVSPSGAAGAGDEPWKLILGGGNNSRGTDGTSRMRQKSLTRTRLTLHEPQPDLQVIPHRIQVWSLGYTGKWLKGDTKIRPSSPCFKERHCKRCMR